MVIRAGQRWRRLTVWLHVLTSVGWMGQALALASLLALGVSTDGSSRVAATTMARHLDMTLLAPLANASAFTGLLLASATAWGFFRYWWVLTKFAITLVQLYVGIFILSGSLDAAVSAARTGTVGPGMPLAVGAGLMASAIAFQGWLSIAKPFPRTPWSAGNRRARPATAPEWIFAMGVGAVIADLAVAAVLGYPLPAFSVVALTVALVNRVRATRNTAPDAEKVAKPHEAVSA